MNKRERVLVKIDQVSAGGKVFNVVFTKKDGSKRSMNCRTGVTKFLVGGLKKYPDECVGVYEMPSNGYKCFYPESVETINGEKV